MSGIFKRLFSTAIFCTSLIFSIPFMLNNPPTFPSLIFFAISELEACPVVISPAPGKFNCPSFSSSVILDIRLLTNWFILPSVAGLTCAFPVIDKKSTKARATILYWFILRYYYFNRYGLIAFCHIAYPFSFMCKLSSRKMSDLGLLFGSNIGLNTLMNEVFLCWLRKLFIKALAFCIFGNRCCRLGLGLIDTKLIFAFG